jgi:serine protease Do
MPSLVPVALVLWALADPPAAEPPAPKPADVVAALESALTEAIAKAEPSVVAIAREKNGDSEETIAVRGRRPDPPPGAARLIAPDAAIIDPRRAPFVQPPRGLIAPDDPAIFDAMSTDYGSGVVVGDEGQILTAFHVVKGAIRLHVRAAGQPQFEAEVIAADPRSDLAVIAPRQGIGPMPSLKPIPIGDSTKLRKGSFLLALGNPFNAARDGAASASWGILANIARRFELPIEELNGPRTQLRQFPTMLQLDSKLNLGMSGGAVVNLRGELVGITTSAASVAGFDGQAGYAIPMDDLGRRITATLKQGKEVEYGLLGINLDPFGTNHVKETKPGTPAGEGGIQTNDVIISVDDVPVTDADSLVLAINRMPIGVPIKLRIIRQNKVLEKTIVLAKFPVEGEVIATTRPAAWRGLRVDYTSVLVNAGFGVEMLSAMAHGGVAVREVLPGEPAAVAGLKKGLIITAVDDHPVRSPAEFAKAVADLKGPVKLTTDQGVVVVKPASGTQ